MQNVGFQNKMSQSTFLVKFLMYVSKKKRITWDWTKILYICQCSFLRESIDEASRQFDIIGCLLASIVKMFFAIICLLTWLNKLPIVRVDSNAAASFALQCCLAWLIWWWHDMKVISNGYDNELWVRNTLQKLIIRTYWLLVSTY